MPVTLNSSIEMTIVVVSKQMYILMKLKKSLLFKLDDFLYVFALRIFIYFVSNKIVYIAAVLFGHYEDVMKDEQYDIVRGNQQRRL